MCGKRRESFQDQRSKVKVTARPDAFCAAEASVRRCGVEGDLLYDDDDDCDDDDLNDDEYYFIKLSEP